MSTRNRSTTCKNQDSDQMEVKTILSEISGKLDNIVDSLHQMTTIQHNRCERNDEVIESLKTTMITIQQNVSQICHNNTSELKRQQTLRNRNKIFGTWTRYLNKRKKLYWQSMSCENTAVIYETWKNSDMIIVPKKFLLKFIPNECIAEQNVRKNASIKTLQSEINLLKARAVNHHDGYMKVDKDMTTFLESHFKDHEPQHMKNLWVEETKAEESKSAKRWKSKQIWMENYASNFNNPQLIKSKQQKISRESTDQNRRNHFTNNHKHQYQARQSNRTDDTNNNKHFRMNKRRPNLQQRNTFREKQQQKQKFTNSRRASNPEANKTEILEYENKSKSNIASVR